MDAQSSWRLVSLRHCIYRHMATSKSKLTGRPADRPTGRPADRHTSHGWKLQFGASGMPSITLRENIPGKEGEREEKGRRGAAAAITAYLRSGLGRSSTLNKWGTILSCESSPTYISHAQGIKPIQVKPQRAHELIQARRNFVHFVTESRSSGNKE